MVPHLTTALSGPLQELEKRVLDRMPDIERMMIARMSDSGCKTPVVPANAGIQRLSSGAPRSP